MMTKVALSKVSLALVLAAGVTGAWIVLGGYVVEALPIWPSEASSQEAVTLLKDGTPLITHYMDGLDAPEYRDLEGHLVLPPVDASYVSPAFLGRTWGRLNMVESPRLTDGQSPGGNWYLLVDEKSPDLRGYFAGYDSQTRRCIGYLGINGFQPQIPSRADMFPGVNRGKPGVEKGLYFVAETPVLHSYAMGTGTRNSPAVFVPTSDGKLYLADIQKRRVTVVHDGPHLLSAAKFCQPDDSISRVKWGIALRFETSIEVLDVTDGHFIKRFSIPEELRTSDFQFGLTSNSEMILERADYGDSLNPTASVRIVQVHQNGTQEDHSVTLAQPASGTRFQANGGLRIPAPVFLAAEIALDRGSEIMQRQLELTWSATARRLVWEYYATFMLAMGLSVICAIACLVRLTRYSATRAERILWPIFIILFGVPGWIGYRFCRTWPVLEACANCKVRVPRDHEECVACATEFPLPARLGTEVFA